MKLAITTIFVLGGVLAFSQEQKHSVSLNYSNNGNISNDLQNFYYSNQAYSPGDDVSSYNEMSYKLKLDYSFRLTENWGAGLSAGYGMRKDKYDIAEPSTWTGDQTQSNYGLALNGLYYWKLDKLEFGTGIELPLTIISDHVQNTYTEASDLKTHYARKTSGGYAFGINSITTVKIFLVKFLYLNAGASFGFTKLNVGGVTSNYWVYQEPEVYVDPPVESDNKFVKTYFSIPELTFGIGFRF